MPEHKPARTRAGLISDQLASLLAEHEDSSKLVHDLFAVWNSDTMYEAFKLMAAATRPE